MYHTWNRTLSLSEKQNLPSPTTTPTTSYAPGRTAPRKINTTAVPPSALGSRSQAAPSPQAPHQLRRSAPPLLFRETETEHCEIVAAELDVYLDIEIELTPTAHTKTTALTPHPPTYFESLLRTQ